MVNDLGANSGCIFLLLATGHFNEYHSVKYVIYEFDIHVTVHRDKFLIFCEQDQVVPS